MQGTWSRTLILWAFLAPVTNVKIAKTNTSFMAYGPSLLVSKILFLDRIIIGDLTQVFFFLLWWPFVVTIVLKHGLSYVDSNDQDKVLKSRATRTIIGFFIAISLLMILTSSLRNFNMLGAIGKQGLCFLRLKVEEIGASIIGVLFGLRGKGAMALEAMSIYFADLERKIESGFGLCSDVFLDSLLSSIFLMAVLLGLGTNRGP